MTTILFLGIEKSWNLIVADRMKRHFGQKHNIRKRIWSDTFQPLHFDSTPPSTNEIAITSSSGDDSGRLIVKPAPQTNHGFALQPPSTPLSKTLPEVSISIANLAKLELGDNSTGSKATEWSSEASKLTSEVAFWLRHLKPTMARTLTSSLIKENPLDTSKSDEGSSPESSDGEVPTRWPGIDSVMVLYMAHQQGTVHFFY